MWGGAWPGTKTQRGHSGEGLLTHVLNAMLKISVLQAQIYLQFTDACAAHE